jgi:hypothetical protein
VPPGSRRGISERAGPAPAPSRRSASQRLQAPGTERGTNEPGTTRPEVRRPRARAAAPRSTWPQQSGPASARSSAWNRTRCPARGWIPGSIHHRRVLARAGAPSARATSSTPTPPRASTATDASRPSRTTGLPVGRFVTRSACAASAEPARTAEASNERWAPGTARRARAASARTAARQATVNG